MLDVGVEFNATPRQNLVARLIIAATGPENNIKVPTLSLEKNPGRFQDLFGAHKCLNIKKKTPFTHNIRSIVHCRNCSMKQNVESQRRQN